MRRIPEKAPGALAGAAQGGNEDSDGADNRDRVSGTQGRNGRYLRVAAAVAFDRRLTAQAKEVLLALAAFANRDDEAWPSIALIAQRLGLSPRQVQRHIQALRDCDYILVRGQIRSRGGRGSNRYVLQFPIEHSGSDADSSGDDSSEVPEVAAEGDHRSKPPSSPIQPDTTSHDVSANDGVLGLFEEETAASEGPVGGEPTPTDTSPHDVSPTSPHDVGPTSPGDVLTRINEPPVSEQEVQRRLFKPPRARGRTIGGGGIRTFDDAEPREPSQAMEHALRSAIGDVAARWQTIFDAMDLGNGRFEAWGQEALRGTLDVRAMLQELHAAKRLAS